ncbi:MAG TPA: hypothetical protein QGF58_14955 [Myxococcota bacterium]|nr:hypothetical protein [Myxococcota bacterium]
MALLVMAVLLVQVGRQLEHSEQAEAELVPTVTAGAGKPLSVRATAPVHVRVVLDGVETVDGTLCRELECRLDVEAAGEIVVELGDLSRATVIYNGSRVAPLGNLSTARRLVFVDDAD